MDETKHLWKVVLSYRYASEENRVTIFAMASNIKDVCDMAIEDYDIHAQDWTEGREPFILSAKLINYYVLQEPASEKVGAGG